MDQPNKAIKITKIFRMPIDPNMVASITSFSSHSNQNQATQNLPEYVLVSAEPNLEFAQSLGTLTLVWNKLEYLLRLYCHRFNREANNTNSSFNCDSDFVLELEAKGGHPKLMELIQTKLNASNIQSKLEIQAIFDKIGNNKKVEGTIYYERCQFEHSFSGQTTQGNYVYYRVGGSSRQYLTEQQVTELKNKLDGLNVEIQQAVEDLNRLIPLKHGMPSQAPS